MCKVSCLVNFHFSFVIFREPEDGVVYEGNQQWEGFSMDLIDAISKILHFQYRFELVPDGKHKKRAWIRLSIEKAFIYLAVFLTGKYGSYNKMTKQWDGLVRHLLDRVSFIVLCCDVLDGDTW